MKFKYFSLRLMHLLCMLIFLFSTLIGFNRLGLHLVVILSLFTLMYFGSIFSYFSPNRVFTLDEALQSSSLDALALSLPVALLLTGKLGVGFFSIILYLLLFIFVITYSVHTVRVYILCKGADIYES